MSVGGHYMVVLFVGLLYNYVKTSCESMHYSNDRARFCLTEWLQWHSSNMAHLALSQGPLSKIKTWTLWFSIVLRFEA